MYSSQASKQAEEPLPRVRTSRKRIEPYDESRIVASLQHEAGLDPETARRIAQSVTRRIRAMKLTFVSAPLIREIVNVVLLEEGLEDARRRYTRVGMPVYDVNQLITYGDRENANLQHNPETIHKLVADRAFDEYALLMLPLDIADAHMEGAIHIHDLEYFFTRPFCQEHDVRFFLRRGLVVDGVGLHTAVAGPAKHPEVAFLHAAKFLAAAQTNWAGGQGYDFFNIWMAPFVQGLSYREIKQLAQMFVYEMSQMYVARGGQTVFSSIALEATVPRVCMDVPAVLPGGIVRENVTYADYVDEAEALFDAFVDVYLEGDYSGKPFNFPKMEVKLRREYLNGKEVEDRLARTAEVAARFGSPYYLNLCPAYMPDIVNSQCCRLFFTPDSTELEDFYNGRLRMGSIQVVTINLPQVAYLARGDDDRLFELLEDRAKLAKKVLLIKREVIKQRMREGALPFACMDCDGEPYLRVDKQVYNIGFVGLNEMLVKHVGYALHESREAWFFGLKVIHFLVKIAAEFSKETGLRFGVLQTPAESAAHRLAYIDLLKFGKDVVVVQGDIKSGQVYYTNSSHVQPNANIPLAERARIESSFHPLVQGGAIFHVWLGEAYPDPEAVWKITKWLAKDTLTSYFAFTKDITLCTKCGFVSGGLLSTCPNCHAPEQYLEWFSRITGYYQRVRRWNPGKLAELRDRQRYGMRAY